MKARMLLIGVAVMLLAGCGSEDEKVKKIKPLPVGEVSKSLPDQAAEYCSKVKRGVETRQDSAYIRRAVNAIRIEYGQTVQQSKRKGSDASNVEAKYDELAFVASLNLDDCDPANAEKLKTLSRKIKSSFDTA